jgi:hypothetical protein
MAPHFEMAESPAHPGETTLRYRKKGGGEILKSVPRGI